MRPGRPSRFLRPRAGDHRGPPGTRGQGQAHLPRVPGEVALRSVRRGCTRKMGDVGRDRRGRARHGAPELPAAPEGIRSMSSPPILAAIATVLSVILKIHLPIAAAGLVFSVSLPLAFLVTAAAVSAVQIGSAA